ncbi:MAG: hypothetical protein HPY71_09810 [Firmicutes bacterium]|nr:hypothetical protein [Bacillota bacterium]
MSRFKSVGVGAGAVGAGRVGAGRTGAGAGRVGAGRTGAGRVGAGRGLTGEGLVSLLDPAIIPPIARMTINSTIIRVVVAFPLPFLLPP